MQPRPASTHNALAPPKAAPLADAQRRQAIGHSHQRCQALGVSAGAVAEICPVPAAALRGSLEQHRRLYQQAAPVMEMLFEQIVGTHSMVVLTDPQGTILHAVGDNGFLEKAQRVALAPGVNWSEASKGTNAIGTTLFNEAPTLVHGSEHFVRANHFVAALRMMGLEAVLGITLPQLADHFRQRGDQPLAVHPPSRRDGQPLWLRAQFNWPTQWPAGAAAVAQPTGAAQRGPAPALPAAAVQAPNAEAHTLQSQEIAAIRRAVQAAGGNIARAARQLGVARNTVYRKLRGG